ncbi:radical SAM protein [Bacteroidota bacterium]
MRIIAKAGKEDLAIVYIAETNNGNLIEFVESLQPPILREKKWVLIVSTLFGCPVACRFCDAGSYYKGKLSVDEIISQIDFLVKQRFPNRTIPVEKFKIQFARLGEPSFNQNVLGVLEKLPNLYEAPGLLPSLSTVAPCGTDIFFERLLEIKKSKYPLRFQFQFSFHSTEENKRDWLIPIKKWDFKKMAEYGNKFFNKGGSKISLNFALSEHSLIEPGVLLQYFNPEIFLIKLTPVNPTYNSIKNNISSIIPQQEGSELVGSLQTVGYEVIVSIGEFEENYIGSNCGQFITTYNKSQEKIEGAYTYELQKNDVVT